MTAPSSIRELYELFDTTSRSGVAGHRSRLVGAVDRRPHSASTCRRPTDGYRQRQLHPATIGPAISSHAINAILNDAPAPRAQTGGRGSGPERVNQTLTRPLIFAARIFDCHVLSVEALSFFNTRSEKCHGVEDLFYRSRSHSDARLDNDQRCRQRHRASGSTRARRALARHAPISLPTAPTTIYSNSIQLVRVEREKPIVIVRRIMNKRNRLTLRLYGIEYRLHVTEATEASPATKR